jgi:hypothetical protein
MDHESGSIASADIRFFLRLALLFYERHC